MTGRAWIMPIGTLSDGLAHPAPIDAAAGFVVFNGYGALAGYDGARIVAHMLKATYRKVGFRAHQGSDTMYVNNDTGYLVGAYAPGTTDLQVEVTTC